MLRRDYRTHPSTFPRWLAFLDPSAQNLLGAVDAVEALPKIAAPA